MMMGLVMAIVVYTIPTIRERWPSGYKVSALQPRDRGLESHTAHDHDSSYDTSTCWFQEADSRVI